MQDPQQTSSRKRAHDENKNQEITTKLNSKSENRQEKKDVKFRVRNKNTTIKKGTANIQEEQKLTMIYNSGDDVGSDDQQTTYAVDKNANLNNSVNISSLKMRKNSETTLQQPSRKESYKCPRANTQNQLQNIYNDNQGYTEAEQNENKYLADRHVMGDGLGATQTKNNANQNQLKQQQLSLSPQSLSSSKQEQLEMLDNRQNVTNEATKYATAQEKMVGSTGVLSPSLIGAKSEDQKLQSHSQGRKVVVFPSKLQEINTPSEFKSKLALKLNNIQTSSQAMPERHDSGNVNQSVNLLPDLLNQQEPQNQQNRAFDQNNQNKKRTRMPFDNKKKLSKILNEVVEIGDISPMNRQRQALNQFAASMSASEDSKLQSPLNGRMKVPNNQTSGYSNNMQDQLEMKKTDFPPINASVDSRSIRADNSKTGLNSPNLPATKRMSALGILDEARESCNRTSMMEKTQPKKNKSNLNENGLQWTSPRSLFQGASLIQSRSPTRVSECELEIESDNEQQNTKKREVASVIQGKNLLKKRAKTNVRESKDQDQVVVLTKNSSASSKRSNNDSFKKNDISTKYKSRVDVTNIEEPLPLLKAGVHIDEPEVMWKKRRIKQNFALNKLSKAEQELQAERDNFLKAQKINQQERQKAEKKLKEVQNRLLHSAANIKVTSNLSINLEEYPHLFKYKIYECFKPQNLKQTRNYIEFLTMNDQDNYAANGMGCTVSEEDLSPELYSYLSKDMETKLPNYINQKKLLQFDSNFESGNLDSVYLVNEAEYNILCKVDTNTKGNTYWFYFKVLNWKPKAKATFNLLNVARDLQPFYSKGMNIWTRTESTNGRFKSDWSMYDKVQVQSFQPNEILRSKTGKKEYAMGRYYNTLKFNCEFPEISMLTKNSGSNGSNQYVDDTQSSVNGGYSEVGPNDQGAPGTVFCFAYAIPYTYTDLISDLQNCKKFLLKNGGIIVNQYQEKSHDIKSKEKSIFMGTQAGTIRKEPTKRKTRKDVLQMNQDSDYKADRHILTKNEIATREMKKIAIQTAKDRMGNFEIQLLKADEETEQQIIKQSNSMKACKLLEIHSDYIYYKQEIVSQSVGGLNIYQITLTKRKGQNCLPYHRKKCMYITARLHSAETCGSLIMKNIITELVTNSEKYDSILSNYVIKLVPLINTDGVTIGNSRSSLVGLDLNRRWADPNASIHPEIFFLKKIMQQQADSQQGISIYCDLHGHNRKENCFFYGCNKAADEGLLSWTKTRLLPKIFASVEQIFDYSSCRFKQDKYKLNTARVVVWNEMKVTNSFTLETSMYSKTVTKDMINFEDPTAVTASLQSIDEKKKLLHVQLQQSDMHQIAKSFLISTAQYIKLEKELEKEWKLSVGWFKPSRLIDVTGEAVRDKQKRENAQKRKESTKKDLPSQTAGGGRKKIERVNSSSIAEPITLTSRRKMISKLNSNTKVNTESKVNAKDANGLQGVLKNSAKRQLSLLNVNNSVLTQENASSKFKVEKKGPNSAASKQNQKEKNKDDGAGDEVVQKTEKKTKKQPKGPKIPVSFNQEDATLIDTSNQSIVTKLKSWKEFFDPEEFQTGIALMRNKSPVIEQDESDEEGGSDSEPSVDNFEEQELEENLCAALNVDDKDNNGANPFQRPFVTQQEISDDNSSMLSIDKEKEEIAMAQSDSEALEPPESATPKNVPNILDLQQQQSDYQANRPEVAVTHVSHVTPIMNSIEAMSRANMKGRKQQRHRGSLMPSAATNSESQRDKIVNNNQDLANQLITQLIMQNNQRITQKASAAPPSGSGQFQLQNSYLNQESQASAQQNYVMRGFSYASPSSLHTGQGNQPDQQQNSVVGQTVYFTDQQRRMQSHRNPNAPSASFSITGQGVSSLNSTMQQPKQQQQQQPNNHNFLIPVQTHLQQQQQIHQQQHQMQHMSQMFEDIQSNDKINISAPKHGRTNHNNSISSRPIGSGAIRNYYSESRSQKQQHQNSSLVQINNGTNGGSYRQGGTNGGLRYDTSLLEQEILAQFNLSNYTGMNDTVKSNSSKLQKTKSFHNSRERFQKQQHQIDQQLNNNFQKAMFSEQLSHRVAGAGDKVVSGGAQVSNGKRNMIKLVPNTINLNLQQNESTVSRLQGHAQTFEQRSINGKININNTKHAVGNVQNGNNVHFIAPPVDSGRYSQIRQTQEELQMTEQLAQARQPQAIHGSDNFGATNQFIHQFAYSPIDPLQQKNKQQIPTSGNVFALDGKLPSQQQQQQQPQQPQSFFNTPRYNHNKTRQSVIDTTVTNGGRVPSQQLSSQAPNLFNGLKFNIQLDEEIKLQRPEVRFETTSQFGNTNFSGINIDSNSNKRTTNYDNRKLSEVNSSMNTTRTKEIRATTNMMNSPQGFDIHKERSSKLKKNVAQIDMNQHNMLVVSNGISKTAARVSTGHQSSDTNYQQQQPIQQQSFLRGISPGFEPAKMIKATHHQHMARNNNNHNLRAIQQRPTNVTQVRKNSKKRKEIDDVETGEKSLILTTRTSKHFPGTPVIKSSHKQQRQMQQNPQSINHNDDEQYKIKR